MRWVEDICMEIFFVTGSSFDLKAEAWRGEQEMNDNKFIIRACVFVCLEVK